MISLYFYIGHMNKQLHSNSADEKVWCSKVITPEGANLPDDALHAIPLQRIENSATGGAPKDLWQQVTSAVTNAVVSVANFIYNGLVALGNLIEHAAEIVAQFAMKLWNTAVSAVKAAVAVVKKIVGALWDGLVNLAKSFFANVIKPVLDALDAYLSNIGSKLKLIYGDYKAGRAPSGEHIKALMDAILPPVVMNFIMAMGIIYTVINIIATFGVPGVGTIVSLAIGAAIGVAMTQYASPSLNFLNGLWNSGQEALRNGLNSLFGVLKNLGLSGIDVAAEIVNTIAFGAGLILTKMKTTIWRLITDAKSMMGIIFGVLSIIAGFDQKDTWVGVAGVLMGFVSLIFGAWSLMDVVETTLDAVLFAINLIAGMNGLMLSAVGLVA